MSLDADILIERRRLKRRLSFWRAAAILALLVVAIAVFARQDGMSASLGFTPHVARVKIEGLIIDSTDQLKLLKKVKDAANAKAVIVFINSPGGTTAGGEALYNALRDMAAKKPVVAVFGTAATSAAYLTGVAADHIVARGNTITGSVGVILQWADVSELLNKIGVKVEEIKSGPLKAVPSPFAPADEAARQATAEIVAETQTWFLGLVSERRKLNAETLESIKTGRVFSGRQALNLGLIDAIGDEQQARAWLAKTKNVPETLSIVEWEEDKPAISWLNVAGKALAGLFTGTAVDMPAFFDENNPLSARMLDGLVSVWQLQKAQ